MNKQTIKTKIKKKREKKKQTHKKVNQVNLLSGIVGLDAL